MAEQKRGPGRPPGSKNKKTAQKPESKAKEKAKEIQARKKADQRVMDEIWAIIAIAIGIFLVIATYTESAGEFGVVVGNILKGLFGFIVYILPIYLILFGVLLFARQTVSISVRTSLLVMLLLLMLATMNSVRFIDPEKISFSIGVIKAFYTDGVLLKSGGFFGMLLASALIKWFGIGGCWIFTIVVTLICLLLIINTPVSRFIGKISDKLEERRLIKENAHLDKVEVEPEVTTTQLTFKDIEKNSSNEEKKPVFERKQFPPATEEKPRTIKIVDGNYSQSGSVKKSNVLEYMKDDTIFGGGTPSGTYGLEQPIDYGEGYGMGTSYSSGAEIKRTGLGAETTEAESGSEPTKDEKLYEPEKKLSNKEAKSAMLTQQEINNVSAVKEYKLPPITLLEKSKVSVKTNDRLLTEKAEKLEDTLKNFHVDARVVQVTQGPTVTRYEVQPAVGVKVSSIVRLADDIALNLEAKSIRIEAPIPGKAAVGIEVENEAVTMVHIRDIIDSQQFKSSKSKITFAVGKDINGNAIVADLKEMPHLLIAGSTGSGKSVCINTIITSLLYKSTPDEVKLILIDPKVVELGNYNGVPHLMIPVVTDPSKAAAALNWAVAEMTDRYKKFAEAGVRDLRSYNEAVRAEQELDKVLPQVVIIIDELADLMMSAPSQIEESICRLAQMARAAGMHLIVATQRPSVDVITGVIKSNIGSRIAFAVSSQIDSRTILDTQGAEKLVGKGDMLLSIMGKDRIRVQGAFISDKEVNKVIEYVKSQVETVDYNQDVLTRIERSETSGGDEDTDDLLPDAIEMVVRSGQASVSMLQRRFRIGYNRAARIVDMMEARGIVSPQDGSRPRQVLITEEEYEMMLSDIDIEEI